MIEPLVCVFENLSDELIEGMVKRSTLKQLDDMQVVLRHTSPETQERWKEITIKTLNIGGKRIMPKVIVYSKSYCGGCEKVKEWLTDKGIAYETKTVIDPKVKDEVVELGYMSVPVTKIEKEDGSVVTIPDYNPELLEEHLGGKN
jgi:glutaredoxin 3